MPINLIDWLDTVQVDVLFVVAFHPASLVDWVKVVLVIPIRKLLIIPEIFSTNDKISAIFGVQIAFVRIIISSKKILITQNDVSTSNEQEDQDDFIILYKNLKNCHI